MKSNNKTIQNNMHKPILQLSTSEMIGLINEQEAVDIVYLHFRKAFDTVSPKILTENLISHWMDE